MIDIGNEDCLGKVGLDMFPGAAIAVSASANLEVERTIHPTEERDEWQ